jgi:hypothetical protein
MCAVVTVTFGVCNSVRLLELIVFKIRKWSVNPIIHNPVESHTHACDNIKVFKPALKDDFLSYCFHFIERVILIKNSQLYIRENNSAVVSLM